MYKSLKSLVQLSLSVSIFAMSNPAAALVDYTLGQKSLDKSEPIQFIVRTTHTLRGNTLANSISNYTSLPLTYAYTMSTGDQVLSVDIKSLDAKFKGEKKIDVLNIAEQISKAPNVVMSSFNPVMTIQTVPDVSEFDKQWDLYEPVAGINATEAWNTTTGSKDVVVGVIDTGIVDHEGFKGSSDSQKILPGYSFVRNSPDVTDDGVKAGSRVVYHGTHVAGTIGAVAVSGKRIAGIAWDTRILPVQVLGSNGAGTMAQIIDGMRWAAGLPMKNGVPSNPNPADVLNMSLGGESPIKLPFLKACQIPLLTLPLQEAVNEIVNNGTSIVVAAGNGDRTGNPADAKDFFPASCDNVITVSSVGREGKRAFYSNYGELVDLSAPGGDQGKGHEHDENGIYSTTAAGKYEFYQGTSMASPHVAGVAALMLAVNKNLTPAQMLQGLTQSARSYPKDGAELACDTAQHICGSGILDANQAVVWASSHYKKEAA